MTEARSPGISRLEGPLEMPHPYVEEDSHWDFRSIYYEQPYPESEDRKADVGDPRIRFAPVVLRMVLMGGDQEEIREASLLYVAHCATEEMRISPARTRLIALAEGENRDEFDSDLAAELHELAVATLRGVALVGCLRAIGWALNETQHPHARLPVAKAAHASYAECGARAGIASLLADDAHAHLSLAERVRPPKEEPKRREIVEWRERLAETGFLLMCRAISDAYEEPWNPFVQERLSRELSEHQDAKAWLPERNRELPRLGLMLLEAVVKKHEGWRKSFEKWVSKGRYDIDAFFVSRLGDDSTQEAETDLLAMMSQLRDAESEMRSLV